jgi:hypothetical protein
MSRIRTKKAVEQYNPSRLLGFEGVAGKDSRKVGSSGSDVQYLVSANLAPGIRELSREERGPYEAASSVVGYYVVWDRTGS